MTSKKPPLMAVLAGAIPLFLGAAVWADSDNTSVAPSAGDATTQTAGQGQQQNGAAMDAPIDENRMKLLEIGFKAATAIPIDPHIKSRSKAQVWIAEACLELDQPTRALVYYNQVQNFRRGVGFADFAAYCARRGYTNGVENFLNHAAEVANKTQDWRKDRIRARIASAYIWLGRSQRANQLAAQVSPEAASAIEIARATRASDVEFSQLLGGLDAAGAGGNIDIIKNTMLAGVELYDRFYDNEERRALVEMSMKTAWAPLPIMEQVKLLMDLSEVALKNEDQAKALELVNETQHLMDSFTWDAEYSLQMHGRLVGIRYRAGDTDRAKKMAGLVLDDYHARRDQIMSVFRVEALCPLAASYHQMGAQEDAVAVYTLALEEGGSNPNGRPRAEDLARICRSMALAGFDPPEEVWSRLQETLAGLREPW